MLRKPRRIAILTSSLLAAVSVPVVAQSTTQASTTQSDKARVQMVANQPGSMARAVDRWEYLAEAQNLGFEPYASFLLAYPGFPRESTFRTRAENALDNEAPTTERLIQFFDQYPPLTNSGRARYALALAAKNRPEALDTAREAWRAGSMSGSAEAYLLGLFGPRFTQADHAARMNALLWQDDKEAAVRQIINVAPDRRDIYMARLALVQGDMPSNAGVATPQSARSDAGYVYNLAKYFRRSGQPYQAVSLLADRPTFDQPAFEPDDMVALMLDVAKGAGARQAAQIAGKVDDLFPPDTDISDGSFRLRDKYTDLMWLGGTKALWSLGDGNTAAPLFYRYGMAAKTPLTRSKGLFWAGRAASQAGDRAAAERYWNQAAQYADQYYGQLALNSLGRAIPSFADQPPVVPTDAERAAFQADPAVGALRAIANNRRDWRTERAFFSALADKADTSGKMALLVDLTRSLGLEEMAVVAGLTAPEHGLSGFEKFGHPTVSVPYGVDWTMSHAIMRQESEFDRNRVSHAGARGLMQLMPGTAREQAGKLGMNYMSANLTGDTHYNIRLGDAYFRRMLDYYNGSYPLALGAYNAGPGRVNQWLRLNGDPRTGEIDYVTWIEKIPSNFETRYYIMRVLGNAVAYDNMYPEKAPANRPRSIDYFLR